MSSSEKLPVKALAAGVYLTVLHPPPLTHCTRTCTYSHREGGEGGELNQREGEMGNRSQSWAENTTTTEWIYARDWLSPVYKL